MRDNGGTGNGGVDTDQSPNSFTLNVTAVNDAPMNSVPGSQTINEDASVTLSTGNGNAISVADVDATTLTVTLSVAHGTLTLASTPASPSGAGDGTGRYDDDLHGHRRGDQRRALGAGLTYNPNANFNGADAISVVTTDGGQTGTGPVGTDSDNDRDQHHRDQRCAGGDRRRHRERDHDQRGQPSGGQTVQALFAGQYSDAADNQIPQRRRLLAGPVLRHRGHRQRLERRDRPVAIFQRRRAGRHRRGVGRLRRSCSAIRRTLFRFNPAPDFNGAGADAHRPSDRQQPCAFGIVNGQVVDLSGAGATGGTTAYSTGTVVLSQDVTAVNDAPVNTVRRTQMINEDASFTLSTGNGNAMQRLRCRCDHADGDPVASRTAL